MAKILMIFSSMILLGSLAFWFVYSMRSRRRSQHWQEFNEAVAKNQQPRD